MRKIFIIMMVLLVTVLSVGCNTGVKKAPVPSDEPGIIGYVMNIDNNGRILVIDPEPQDFSDTGGVAAYYDAIWFSDAPEDINIGEKVKVWYDIIRESYPGQSEVIHLEIVPSEKPQGANLTEAEALYEALTSDLSTKDLVVEEIDYNPETDIWHIKLKGIWDAEIYDIQIEDK